MWNTSTGKFGPGKRMTKEGWEQDGQFLKCVQKRGIYAKIMVKIITLLASSEAIMLL
jgi:hypothetical protein